MNIFDTLHTGNLVERMCLISMGCLMITGAIAAIIIAKKVFNTSEISPSDLLIGIIGATLAELLMLALAALTIPLGGEILHKYGMISLVLNLALIPVISIDCKILSKSKDTSNNIRK